MKDIFNSSILTESEEEAKDCRKRKNNEKNL